MERSIFHIFLHFFIPFAVAKITWRKRWIRPFIFMALTMAVDFDHFLADTVFDPTRCSLNFHPLHSWYAIGVYLVLLFSPRIRIFAIGLLIHMTLDGIDCLWMNSF